MKGVLIFNKMNYIFYNYVSRWIYILFLLLRIMFFEDIYIFFWYCMFVECFCFVFLVYEYIWLYGSFDM